MSDFEGMGVSERPDAGAGIGEATAEQVEAFREAMRAAAARRQQLQKSEKKAKRKDQDMAHMVVKLLQDSSASELLEPLLVLLQQGVAVNLLIGLISLAFPTLHAELYRQQQREEEATRLLAQAQEFEQRLAQRASRDFNQNQLDPEIKDRINLWIQDILTLCLEDTAKALRFVQDEEGTINPHLILLTKRILLRYLDRHHIIASKNQAKDFAFFIVRGIVIQLTNKHRVLTTLQPGDPPELTSA